MIEIFKLHWKFVKSPTAVIKDEFSKWPISIGLALYILYLLRSNFQSGDSYTKLRDILFNIYNLHSDFAVYIYIIFTVIYSLLIFYYLIPFFVRIFSGKEKDEFDPSLYRKLLFYSPTSYVIFFVYFMLPLQILLSIYLFFFEAGLSLIAFGIIYGLLGLWSLVLMTNMFIIQWKGLDIFYGIKGIKTFTLVFLIPLIGIIPMMLIYGHKIFDFLKNYVA